MLQKTKGALVTTTTTRHRKDPKFEARRYPSVCGFGKTKSKCKRLDKSIACSVGNLTIRVLVSYLGKKCAKKHKKWRR